MESPLVGHWQDYGFVAQLGTSFGHSKMYRATGREFFLFKALRSFDTTCCLSRVCSGAGVRLRGLIWP